MVRANGNVSWCRCAEFDELSRVCAVVTFLFAWPAVFRSSGGKVAKLETRGIGA